MKAKKKGGFLKILGLLLIVGALALAVWNMHSENAANESSSLALQQLAKEIPESVRYVPVSEGAAGAYEAPIPEDEIEYPDYVLNPEMDMPVSSVNGWDYIGVLEIPALGLSLPVMSTWSYPALNVAPCRYEGSAYTNDLIIAAHNFNCHFGQLKNLPEGSAVVFTDMAGNRFDYVSVLTETLQPAAVEEMHSGGWDLSLFTCTVGGQYRVTVRCEEAVLPAEIK